jgi:hypothetical protein
MAMLRTILVAETNGDARSVGWVSIAEVGGDVSAGLTDRNVVVAHPGGECEGSRNPHFTFHAPIYHHLRQEGKPELLAGLMDVTLMLTADDVVPWVRLVSRPFETLKPLKNMREGAEAIYLPVADDRASVLIELDFVKTVPECKEVEFRYFSVADQLVLRLAMRSCELSGASLTLLWQG